MEWYLATFSFLDVWRNINRHRPCVFKKRKLNCGKGERYIWQVDCIGGLNKRSFGGVRGKEGQRYRRKGELIYVLKTMGLDGTKYHMSLCFSNPMS